MTRSGPAAILAANQTKTNKPGMCQQVTRTWLGAPSAGDRDGDRDADAVDGWRSEPTGKRHTSRRPMVGAPVAWSGGSGGFGHRALCVGYSKAGEPMIRSTDAGGRGIVATKPLSWFEKNWGLRYLGWSTTMTGQPIEGLRNPPGTARRQRTRGTKIDAALATARAAKATKGSNREAKIKAFIKAGEAVPYIN